MQRLTKYQLLLKDLVESSNIVCGKPELEEALNELLSVIKTVNDSLHSVTIKGLPSAANPLGPLITQNVFQVITGKYSFIRVHKLPNWNPKRGMIKQSKDIQENHE